MLKVYEYINFFSIIMFKSAYGNRIYWIISHFHNLWWLVIMG
jgi:hypothetical protein